MDRDNETIDKVTDDKLLDLYGLGYSDIKIASLCAVSRTSVYDWRMKNGLESNSKGKGNFLSQKDYDYRMEMINAGKTDEEIADIVGITRQSFTMWRQNRGIFKSITLPQRYDDLSDDERQMFDYLMERYYPADTEVHLMALTKFVHPRCDVIPTPKQRGFVRKIKVRGLKTVYYFDDTEYNCVDEAMELFITMNPDIYDSIWKIRVDMPQKLYGIFMGVYRKLQAQPVRC